MKVCAGLLDPATNPRPVSPPKENSSSAEPGGFSFGDTNVCLIVSNPGLKPSVVKAPVATSQVAPSILHALGLDPQNLESVSIEKTEVLPGLPF